MAIQISIVTPSYNQAAFIPHTIQSILTQNVPHLEYIIMDGGSTDGTVDILRAQTDPRLRWTSERDKGQSDAINRGMQQTTGDILAYLNSDDVLLPDALPFVADYFESHPEVDVVCGCVYTIDSTGQRVPPDLVVSSLSWWDVLTMRMVLPQQAIFWRRRVMDEIGLFEETLHYRMDYDYWIRAKLAGFKFATTDRFLAEFRVHGVSKSISQDERFWRDWYTILDKIYARSNLPAEVISLQSTSYAYASFYAGENYFRHGNYTAARPYLAKFVRGPASLRQKAYAALMLIDSTLHTGLTRGIVRLYRRLKGVNPGDGF